MEESHPKSSTEHKLSDSMKSRSISSYDLSESQTICQELKSFCSEPRFFGPASYGSRNFLVGSFGGSSGSMLGQNELEKRFPNRKMTLRIISWNMAAQHPLFCIEYFIELLSAGTDSSPAEILVFCAQEAPSNRREILVQMQSVLGPNYVLFAHASNGSLDTSIFLHRDLIWYISVPQCSSICTRSAVQTKGAVALSFILFGTSFAVINSHFKANERNFNQRLQDYNKILEDFDLPKQGFTSGYRHKCANPMDRFDHVLWVGDLNFRVNKSRAEVDQLLTGPNALRHVKSLLEADELRKAMESGKIFEGFEEGDICFLPTFKFDINSDAYDTSEKQRVPSYTDRILYRSKKKEDVKCLAYDSLSHVRCSDHRPVYAVFTVSLKPGRDNIALSAGAFHREIYIEGNRRRALQFDLAPKKTPLQKNKTCSIQ